MIVEQVHDAIAALLTTDATFIAALTGSIASGGCGLRTVPAKLLANQPMDQIQQLHANALPAWVLEPLPGEALASQDSDFGLTIGSGQQTFRHSALASLVWHEVDRETAYRQRLRIPERTVQLFLRAGTLGLPNCAGAIVRAVAPDGGGTHPFHILRVEITADVFVQRE